MVAGLYLPRKLDRAFAEMGETSERVKALLTLHGSPEYVSYWDDFLGDSAGTWPASANWGYPATAGTGTEVITLEASAGGVLLLTTGANASDSAGQGVGLHWTADNGFYFITRFQLDTLASSKFEVGMTDALTDDAGAVDTKATPTFTATDCAIVVRDTTDDTNVTFVSNGGTTDANADWSGTFAAATYYIVEIVGGGPTSTTGDNVTAYINGQRIGSGNINGATLLTPWVHVTTRTTATRGLSVDYLGCIGRRSF